MTLTLDAPRKPLAAVLPPDARLALLDAQCERIADRSFTIALRIIGDEGRAEALVRAIFLDAGRAMPAMNVDPGCADGHVLSIVRERALVMAREDRADSRPARRGRAADARIQIPLDMLLPGGFDLAEFRDALETLSDGQREAIDLAYYGGLTQRDVAMRTGLPVHSVMRQLRLALLFLRRSVDGMNPPTA